MDPYFDLSDSSDSSSSLSSSLSDRIIDSFAKSVFDVRPQNFLPRDCLATLITEADIIHEMEFPNPEEDKFKKLVTFIHQHAKKVFATTVVCGIYGNRLVKIMVQFQKSNFDDNSLPLKEEKIPELRCFHRKYWTKMSQFDFLQSRRRQLSLPKLHFRLWT